MSFEHVDFVRGKRVVRLPVAGLLAQAALEADPVTLERILCLGRPGAALRVRINESALAAAGIAETPFDSLQHRLRQGFAMAGVTVAACGLVPVEADTSWGARVRAGAPARVLAIEGALAARKGEPRPLDYHRTHGPLP